MKVLIILLAQFLVLTYASIPAPTIPPSESCSLNYDEDTKQVRLRVQLQQLTGPPGEPGSEGPQGEAGKQGEKGDQGPPGEVPMDKLNEMEEKIQALEKRVKALEPLKGTAGPNGYTYWLTKPMNWKKAQRYCKGIGAKLATVGARDRDVLKFFVDDVMTNTDDTWIGLHDRKKEGDWVWDDGVVANSNNTYWSKNEPNNSFGNEDCGVVNYKGSINDQTCSKKFHGICESTAKE